MKTQDEINEIRHEDQRKLETVKNITDTAIARKRDEIDIKAQRIKDRIQELVDRKGEVFDQPYSKSYTLELLKRGLKEKRKEWFCGALAQHARDCQVHAAGPLDEANVRLGLGDERKIWKMVYAIISEEDLEEAVATLPDIGMSVAEKEAEIKKIDAEIETLKRQIKIELDKL